MRVKFSGSTVQKLAFVKIVKSYSGLGLREAKMDITDLYWDNKQDKFDLNIQPDAFPKFKLEMHDIGITVNSVDRKLKLERLLDNSNEKLQKITGLLLNNVERFYIVDGCHVVDIDKYKFSIIDNDPITLNIFKENINYFTSSFECNKIMYNELKAILELIYESKEKFLDSVITDLCE